MPAIPGLDDGASGSAMDTGETGQMRAPREAGTSRAGSGPGMGASGISAAAAPSIFTSKQIPGTTFQREYCTTTRWILPACKTAKRTKIISDPTSDITADGYAEIQTRVGGSAQIPWDRIAMYLSPYEYYEIRKNYISFFIKDISATVTSLGTRAPYSTNTSNIEVANSNLQSLIMDYYGINEHYRTLVQDDINPILDKIRGDVDIKGGGETEKNTDFTTTYTNISSRLETRVYNKRLVLCQGLPLIKSGANSATLDSGYVHSNINLLQHCHKMINASNHLGISFTHDFEVNKEFYRQDQCGTEAGDVQHVEIPSYDNHYDKTIGADILNNEPKANNMRRGWIPPNYYKASVMEISTKGTTLQMPTFAFGHYLLRNITTDLDTDVSTEAYNSIVDLNHEFILEMRLTAIITVNMPMYYNPSIAPDTYWYGEYERQRVAGTLAAPMLTIHAFEQQNGIMCHGNATELTNAQGSYICNPAYVTTSEMVKRRKLNKEPKITKITPYKKN